MSGAQPLEHAGNTESYLDDDFKQWLEALLEKNRVPGMSIAVVRGDKVESAGYGLARLPDVPATADTLYCMGSTTKAFTATLMGMLIHDDTPTDAKRKKLKWSTPVSQILPDDFVLTDSYITKTTTIEDALSHRTGVAGHDLFWGPTTRTASSVTQSLRHLGPIVAPFRGRFQYNNLMYGVVGHVIERLSGRSYSETLKERILEPLGMHKTYSGVKAASQALTQGEDLSFARGYYWVGDDAKAEDADSTPSKEREKAAYYLPEAYIDLGALGSAGDNISTIKDYAKWAQAMLTAAKPAEDKKREVNASETHQSSTSSSQVITHSLFEDLTTPRSINLPVMAFFPDVTILPNNAYMTPSLYALGWMINPFVAPGEQVVEHAGGLPGFGAHVYLVPNHDFGVVAVGNTSMTANKVCEAVARELIGRKLGKEKEDRRLQDSVEKEMQAVNTDKAQEADTKDVPAEKPVAAETAQASENPFDDNDIGIPGRYAQPAYGTFAVSRSSKSLAFDSKKPEIDGCMIERKEKHDNKSGSSGRAPLVISPIPRRGLNYRLIMHNPRRAANDEGKIVYGLEMLLCHGDLSGDPFSNLKQTFPDEMNAKYPLKDQMVWQSQKYDKKGAVVELNEQGQVRRLGLQLFRVDVPEKSAEDIGEDELEDEWGDRLVWFEPMDNE